MMLATRGLTVYHKYGGKLEFERAKDGRDWKITGDDLESTGAQRVFTTLSSNEDKSTCKGLQ